MNSMVLVREAQIVVSQPEMLLHSVLDLEKAMPISHDERFVPTLRGDEPTSFTPA